MAALTVVTSANIANARVGNQEFVYIQTCITKAGQARTGLTKQEVTFDELLVGPGGYAIEWNPSLTPRVLGEPSRLLPDRGHPEVWWQLGSRDVDRGGQSRSRHRPGPDAGDVHDPDIAVS